MVRKLGSIYTDHGSSVFLGITAIQLVDRTDPLFRLLFRTACSSATQPAHLVARHPGRNKVLVRMLRCGRLAGDGVVGEAVSRDAGLRSLPLQLCRRRRRAYQSSPA